MGIAILICLKCKISILIVFSVLMEFLILREEK